MIALTPRAYGYTPFLVATAMWSSLTLLAMSTFGQFFGFVLAIALAFATIPFSPLLSFTGIDPAIQLAWLITSATASFLMFCMFCCARRFNRRDHHRAYKALAIATHTIGIYAVVLISVTNAQTAFSV